MSSTLLNLFRPHKALASVDISYLRHDPVSNTLILYNNATRSLKKVRLVVVNKEKQSFAKDFERLGARTSEEVSLASLTDSAGKAFSGQILKILIHHNKLKATFEPEKNKFKRNG